MAVLVLIEEINPNLDKLKVLEMVAIHDIVEIDAGDTFCYDSQIGKYEREKEAAERIFGILDSDLRGRFMELWEEFEKRESEESVFANALDRLMPIIQNHENGGVVWKENGIKYDQVLERNSIIGDCSDDLWNYTKMIFEKALKIGWLTDSTSQDRPA